MRQRNKWIIWYKNVISDHKNLNSHQKTEYEHKYEYEYGDYKEYNWNKMPYIYYENITFAIYFYILFFFLFTLQWV